MTSTMEEMIDMLDEQLTQTDDTSDKERRRSVPGIGPVPAKTLLAKPRSAG